MNKFSGKQQTPSSSTQPGPPYRNRPPLSTDATRPPNPAAAVPPLRKFRVQRPAKSTPSDAGLPSSNSPSGTPARIVKALAWAILAVFVAGATATGVAYFRLRSIQARLYAVDVLMEEGHDTAALDALREMAEPAARHGLLVREVGTRTVRVLVHLGRINDAEDAADALATLVPPDDAEPWTLSAPGAVLCLPQWAAGDVLYGSDLTAWDRWAGYRELLASMGLRDQVEMEKLRVLLAARHPNNPLCPGKPKPVIREADTQDMRTSQNAPTSPTGLTVPPPQLATDSSPPPQTTVVPVPVPASTPAPAVVTPSDTQAVARIRVIDRLRDRQAAIQAQLKILHAAANDNLPSDISEAQLRLDQHHAEMQKFAQKAEESTGNTRIRTLDQLRQMKYREMQLQREAGPPQNPRPSPPTQQETTLRSELSGIEEQLKSLKTEPVASKRL